MDFEKHIVTTTNDGSNVMAKFERENPMLEQPIDLGVVETFLKMSLLITGRRIQN